MPASPQAQPAAQPGTPRPRRAATTRRSAPAAPKVPYPDLPERPHTSGGTVTGAQFWRAAFLRHLAQRRAAEPHLRHACAGNDRPFAAFMARALLAKDEEVARCFEQWMRAGGGLAGAGEVLQ